VHADRVGTPGAAEFPLLRQDLPLKVDWLGRN